MVGAGRALAKRLPCCTCKPNAAGTGLGDSQGATTAVEWQMPQAEQLASCWSAQCALSGAALVTS